MLVGCILAVMVAVVDVVGWQGGGESPLVMVVVGVHGNGGRGRSFCTYVVGVVVVQPARVVGRAAAAADAVVEMVVATASGPLATATFAGWCGIIEGRSYNPLFDACGACSSGSGGTSSEGGRSGSAVAVVVASAVVAVTILAVAVVE